MNAGWMKDFALAGSRQRRTPETETQTRSWWLDAARQGFSGECHTQMRRMQRSKEAREFIAYSDSMHNGGAK